MRDDAVDTDSMGTVQEKGQEHGVPCYSSATQNTMLELDN